MSSLKFFLLGHPQLKRDGQTLDFRRRKVVALLTYLATKRTPVSRDALASMFWPEFDQSQALSNLRREMARLKKMAGPILLPERSQIQIDPSAKLWIDSHEFERLILEGSIDSLKKAIELYKDDFMAGFLLAGCHEFDDWQFFEREGLKDYLNQATQQLLAWHHDRGEYEQAIPYARRWVGIDNLNEGAHQALMLLYAQAGQRAAALRQFEECSNLLRVELGLPPEQSTIDLYEKVRSGKVVTVKESALEENYSRPTIQHNLPAETGQLIGRSDENAELFAKLIEEQNRLITVTGPGGIGKSRLALAVAHLFGIPNTESQNSSTHFSDGIIFVSLTSIESRNEVILALINALGLTSAGIDHETLLFNFIANKKLLLFLDNFEHLLDHVGLVIELLESGGDVTCLITSRARLRLSHEMQFPLIGLSTDGSNPLQSNAARLLLAHAKNINPEIDLNQVEISAIDQICRNLQGNPLALVLAAGWSDMLSFKEIAAEIESSIDFLSTDISDVPERQKSMRGVFDQSWKLLNSADQEAFAKLAIFKGGFSREAARKIANASLRQLSSMLGKSLIYLRHDNRYEIHELLREFALEKLETNREAAHQAHERFSKYFGAYTDSLVDNLKGNLQKDALSKISLDLNNIRSGLHWLINQAAREPALLRSLDLYIEPLFHYFDIQGRFREGANEFSLVAKLIVRLEERGPLSANQLILLGKVIGRQGWFTFHIGQHQQAKQLLHRSLKILQDSDAKSEIAFSHNYLGAINRHLGDYANAEIHLKHALQIYRQLKDEFGITVSLNILGQLAYLAGDYKEARLLCDESLAIKRRIGDKRGMIYSLSYSGRAALAQKELAEAERLFSESLKISKEIGDPRSTAISQSNLSEVLIVRGDINAAKEYLQESLNIYEEVWDRIGTIMVQTRLGNLAVEAKEFDRARLIFAQALEIAKTLAPSPAIIDLLVSFAEFQCYVEVNQRDSARQIVQTIKTHPNSSQSALERSNALHQKLLNDGILPPEGVGRAEDELPPVNLLIEDILLADPSG